MRIAVTGATGFIGSVLVTYLESRGHEVWRMVRRPDEDKNTLRFFWRPEHPEIDAQGLEGMDAVVHLAGTNVARPWTPPNKHKIYASRVEGTTFLCDTLVHLEHPPRVLVSASAFGYYGNRGDRVMTEDCGPGEGFLADVCIAWERATLSAVNAGIRVVNTRFGLVLGPHGGLLDKMVPIFEKGLGAYLGSGKQYMSWVALDDLVRVIELMIQEPHWVGAVNVMAPQPVTNREFAQTLARVLGRPEPFRVPAFMVRMLPGGMGEELFLYSTRAVPEKLQQAGYPFLYPTLEGALRHVLLEAWPKAA